ncbi:MAG: hypothetical protein AB1767_04095 [Bacillota bacterium]
MEAISWEAIMDFAFLSAFLVVATLLRNKIKFLQKFLIPNCILAGFLVLLLNQQVLKVIDLPMDRLGNYVYHLLTAIFIAMGLRGTKVKRSHGTVAVAMVHCQTYSLQILLGMVFVLVLTLFQIKDIFPTFGMQLMLGYGNNPGVAYSLGQSWEPLGFVGGGGVGLTFGALGFLWAYFLGVIIINWGVRRKKTAVFEGYDQIPSSVFTGLAAKDEAKKEAGRLTTAAEAIETLSLHLALIGLVFLITNLFITYITNKLGALGDIGAQLSSLIWGFSFVVGTVFALLLRWVFDRLKFSHIIDSDLMTRTSGAFIDYMIVASIAAIPLLLIKNYWVEILVLSTMGGLATAAWVAYLVKKIHLDYHFERFLASFGLLTGTATSGLALLRVVDAEFATPVAEDLVYGSGLIMFVGLPVMVLAGVPAMGVVKGESLKYIIISIAVTVAYMLLLYLGWKIYKYFYNRKNKVSISEQA